MAKLNELITELNNLRNPAKAKILARFFKTGPGQYGAGDIFLGLTVPLQRSVAKKYLSLSLPEIKKLLDSKIHERRFTALEILVMKFEAANPGEQKQIHDFYLLNSARINNWDLVDTSAPYIVGEFLVNRPRRILYKLARSKNLWQKRIAIVASYAFIRRDDSYETLQIAKLLLPDSHDLIHKAVGWMLREVGKRDTMILRDFLRQNYAQIPRTTLRYAIERLPATERKKILAGKP
jgi:3-methyladenine DNA glycosylase AlkD